VKQREEELTEEIKQHQADLEGKLRHNAHLKSYITQTISHWMHHVPAKKDVFSCWKE
jgi:hypothetical protein